MVVAKPMVSSLMPAMQLRGMTKPYPMTMVGTTKPTSGTIYDPSTGNTYSCRLTLEGADRLLLRGYLGIPLIGRTTTWTRVGTENRMCRDGT